MNNESMNGLEIKIPAPFETALSILTTDRESLAPYYGKKEKTISIHGEMWKALTRPFRKP